MKFWTAGALVLAASLPVVANDTSAVLTTGGLEFVSNSNVVMQSEELFISRKEIRVVYEFRNDSAEDQHILVAFPMPEIKPDFYSPVAFPSGPDDNLFEFETTFDGKSVESTLNEYAYAVGVDRTELLRSLDLPLVPITENASDATDHLDDATRDKLLHLGMLTSDEYDAGQGWEKHYYPAWTYRATYTWEATFPAGKTVKVEHRYKPSVGGTVGVTFLGEPSEGYDPAREYATKYCVDDAFTKAVKASIPKGGEYYEAPFFESWISYILTTGGNWGGGAIENFRLVIDKGAPENLVSFCGEGVKKIGPTTFEMVAKDFWPERELDVLILERQTN